MDGRLNEENIGKSYFCECTYDEIYYSCIVMIVVAPDDEGPIIQKGDIVYKIVSATESCKRPEGTQVIWMFDKYPHWIVKEI